MYGNPHDPGSISIDARYRNTDQPAVTDRHRRRLLGLQRGKALPDTEDAQLPERRGLIPKVEHVVKVVIGVLADEESHLFIPRCTLAPSRSTEPTRPVVAP